MHRPKLSFLKLLASLCLIIASQTVATPVQAASHYESADCKFDIPASMTIHCGNLTVPEERAKHNGRTIVLHVAMIKSASQTPAPDPVVYLEGGPGGSALEGIVDWAKHPILDNRDLILFDQRGTGYSEPSLNCPETGQLDEQVNGQKMSITQIEALKLKAVVACRDRLKKTGVNLAAYTTAESAADVEDLRLALGYPQWNVYGISYGTRLALDVMRDYPKGVRSVVIDSVYPPHEDAWAEGPANADRAFKVLFQTCAADISCNTAYPNLEKVFYALVAKLDAKPISMDISNSGTILINGSDLINTVFEALYSVDSIPSLPKLIYDTNRGDYGLFKQYLSDQFGSASGFDGTGMYYSIECGEKVTFTTKAKLEVALKEYPQLANSYKGDTDNGEVIFDICAQWGAKPAVASENEPVKSDIPTLVMAGELDPITPPVWAETAAKTLSHNYYFEYPGVGHAVTFSGDCPQNMMLAFLDDPKTKPNASCIQQMKEPEFTLP